MTPSTRAQVIQTLLAIQKGQSLAVLLDPLLQKVMADDKAFAHALLLTTLRHWHATARLVDKLADKPIDEMQVRTATQVGITQLIYLEVADHASIFETVEALKQIGFERASGLTNAILRKVAKNPSKYRKIADKNHSLPNWLARQLKQDWGEQYNQLTQALRQPAPLFLRPNAKFCTVQDYAKLLQEADISHQIVPTGWQETFAICLDDAIKISDLPNFAAGWVSVQDVHAQLAGHLLTDIAGYSGDTGKPLNILDACCAPGGKTAHLLELTQVANKTHATTSDIKHLLAIDNDANRLKRVHDNLSRLQLVDAMDDTLSIQTQDATTFASDKKFYAILLDAPCTATGVIRRHPDIGLLRNETDIEQTLALQADILHNLWQNLTDGGYLLYVTCSILQAENETQMASFLASHPDANVAAFELNLPNQFKRPIGWQCLPLDASGGDGFYYAMLRKM